MKTYSLLVAVVLVLPVLAQDQEDIEKARKVFTADITRAILTGEIPAPDGFDKAMAEQIGKKRLQALRTGAETVQGRDERGRDSHLFLEEVGVGGAIERRGSLEGRDTMTGKEFVHRLANDKSDIIQLLLDILSKTGSRYCVIGGASRSMLMLSLS